MLKPNGLFIVVSAQDSYEGYKQFAWDPEELEAIANEKGLELVSQDSTMFDQDDWYSISHERVFMIFKKPNRRGKKKRS